MAIIRDLDDAESVDHRPGGGDVEATFHCQVRPSVGRLDRLPHPSARLVSAHLAQIAFVAVGDRVENVGTRRRDSPNSGMERR
jgi:hypothetical protein